MIYTGSRLHYWGFLAYTIYFLYGPSLTKILSMLLWHFSFLFIIFWVYIMTFSAVFLHNTIISVQFDFKFSYAFSIKSFSIRSNWFALDYFRLCFNFFHSVSRHVFPSCRFLLLSLQCCIVVGIIIIQIVFDHCPSRFVSCLLYSLKLCWASLHHFAICPYLTCLYPIRFWSFISARNWASNVFVTFWGSHFPSHIHSTSALIISGADPIVFISFCDSIFLFVLLWCLHS